MSVVADLTVSGATATFDADGDEVIELSLSGGAVAVGKDVSVTGLASLGSGLTAEAATTVDADGDGVSELSVSTCNVDVQAL